ncbi:hypothetical protein CDD81_583 [Ophiocordyceps australis]|uniref:Uncharacterized protein n=1 Tax=Ophiocordyceps australis TaxID=1399860 RepID=A0A2C5XKZ9_9HYPO|nr:hypothetical protein CDD81_583 [Ophiocordyceps australis]
MKLAIALITLAFSMATWSLAVLDSTPKLETLPRVKVLETRHTCGSYRARSDVCTGRRLGPQNSFSNCKNRQGKCCAKYKEGSGGINVGKAIGREDCGFCFTGSCKS